MTGLLKADRYWIGTRQFRLLFVTSGKHGHATEGSPDINVTTTTFVQNHGQRTAAPTAHSSRLGRPDILTCSQSKIPSSSVQPETVSARSNTGTTGSGGVPIYWVGGEKVADDYRRLLGQQLGQQESPRNQGGDRISISDTSITGRPAMHSQAQRSAGEIHTSFSARRLVQPLSGSGRLEDSLSGPHGYYIATGKSSRFHMYSTPSPRSSR